MNNWTPIKLSEIPLTSIGSTVQIVGALYADRDNLYVVSLPDANMEGLPIRHLAMSSEEWETFIDQTDKVEVMALVKSETGEIGKALVKKTTRIISQHISWNVYRRDHYRCRYCGNNKVPLTVDHLVRWEDGGPSIEDNLVTSCKECNKIRGDQDYGVWLKSSYYRRVSQSLPGQILDANDALLPTLVRIPRHPLGGKRSR